MHIMSWASFNTILYKIEFTVESGWRWDGADEAECTKPNPVGMDHFGAVAVQLLYVQLCTNAQMHYCTIALFVILYIQWGWMISVQLQYNSSMCNCAQMHCSVCSVHCVVFCVHCVVCTVQCIVHCRDGLQNTVATTQCIVKMQNTV